MVGLRAADRESVSYINGPCSNKIMSFNVGDKVTWEEFDPEGVKYGTGLITRTGIVQEIVQQEPLYKVKTDYGISAVKKAVALNLQVDIPTVGSLQQTVALRRNGQDTEGCHGDLSGSDSRRSESAQGQDAEAGARLAQESAEYGQREY